MLINIFVSIIYGYALSILIYNVQLYNYMLYRWVREDQMWLTL